MRLIAENLWTRIDGPYPVELLDEATSFCKTNYFFHPSFKAGHWDGRIRFIKFDSETECYHFPTGLLDRVIELLEKKQWRYEIVDNREFTPVEPNYELLSADGSGSKISLQHGKYYFQSAALDAMLMRGRGILKAGTGGGKTTIAAAMINSIGKRTLWLTHRRNLMYQTRERLQHHFGKPVGILGDSESEIQEVTVAMMQTVANVIADPEKNLPAYWFVKNAEVLIGDEGHHLSGPQFYSSFAFVSAQWRYLLTATPPNLHGEGMYLVAQTGPVIYEISAQELIKQGVLIPPRIWFVKYNNLSLPKSGLNWHAVYKNGVLNNPDRTAATTMVARQFASEKKPTLTLVVRVEHGQKLADAFEHAGVRTYFIRGSVTEKNRNKAFEALRLGELDNIVAVSSIFGEGADYPWLRAIINATGTKGGGDSSEGDTGHLTIQFLGRGLRPYKDKPHFDYVDFFDDAHKNIKQATLARVRTLENEGYSRFVKYYSDYQDDSTVAVG